MIRDDRLPVVVVVLVVAISTAGLVVATPTTDRATTTADTSPATAGQDPVTDPTDCVNGTSEAVLACGYNPGPTAVQVDPQTTTGRSMKVRAVDIDEGGFVAIHRISYVDGAFVESVVGVSDYLSPGLHEQVGITFDQRLDENATLVAVVYRDTDGDRTFDFAETDGQDDRPYTNTYSEETGTVTDEAGDVIGDTAPVTVAGGVRGYAGQDGVVDSAELIWAINDWSAGELSTAVLRDVIEAWTESSQVG